MGLKILGIYRRSSRLQLQKNYEIIVIGSLPKLGDDRLYDLLLPLAAGNSRVMEEVLARVGSEAEPAVRERVQEVYDRLGYFDRRLKALRSRRARLAAYSAELLGNVGDTRAIAPLAELLEKSDERVADAALYALGKIGSEESLAGITRMLDHPTRWTQDRIAAAVERVGPAAVLLLRQNLRQGTEMTRSLAAEILGRLGIEESVPELREALRDAATDIRAKAAAALGRIRDRAAVPDLLGALADGRWEVRCQAAMALGKIGDSVALPELQEALRDAEWWVRANAQEAIRHMGRDGERALHSMLWDEDRFAREMAAEALQEMGIIDRYLSLAEAGESREELSPVIRRMAEMGLDGPLQEALLAHQEDSVRIGILRDLEGLARPELETVYRVLADGPAGPVREEARRILRGTRDGL